ncbi:tuftelin-interacting protein [Cryptosporidium ryanae]|uniref:tuftelin-interacting protein n=1 Tax=Cryptosporidium ryanae TaxID=515981 RepID=UPI00351A8AB1|nr:tuftelin-interacting protein [Cryptosporidium ryanae]
MEDKVSSHGEFHTKYGKGFEIIRKMGFKGGGLGADGTGISEPIDVRGCQSSIGARSEKKHKRDVGSPVDSNGDGADSELGEGRTGLDLNTKPDVREGYLDETLELLLSFRDELSARKGELEASLREDEAEAETMEGEMRDLERRRRILLDLSALTRKLSRCFVDFSSKIEMISEGEELTSLFAEAADGEVSAGSSNDGEYDKIGVVGRAVEELIEGARSAFLGSDSNSSADAAKSYLPYGKIIKSALEDVLRELYAKNWSLRKDPEYGISVWVSIKRLFVLFENNGPREEEDYDSRHCYERLAVAVVGRSLENYYTCFWDPVGESEFGLYLLQVWDGIVPGEYVRTRLLEEVIWRRQSQQLQLQAGETGAEDLNVSKHKWLFSWLPYYHKHGSGYFIARLMSRRIEKALDAWEPPETWPITLLSIWRPVLESNMVALGGSDADDRIHLNSEHAGTADETNEFMYLILSMVYPKLSAYLEDCLTVRQDHELQDLSSIDHLDEWFKEDLLDKFLVSQLFVEVIGPKWLRCLGDKLSGVRNEYLGTTRNDGHPPRGEHASGAGSLEAGRAADEPGDVGGVPGDLRANSRLKDILSWYEYWRNVFSRRVMVSSRTKAFFARGLIMIDFHIHYYSSLSRDGETDTNRWIDYAELERDCGAGSGDHLGANSSASAPTWEDSFVLGLLEWVSSETGGEQVVGAGPPEPPTGDGEYVESEETDLQMPVRGEQQEGVAETHPRDQELVSGHSLPEMSAERQNQRDGGQLQSHPDEGGGGLVVVLALEPPFDGDVLVVLVGGSDPARVEKPRHDDGVEEQTRAEQSQKGDNDVGAEQISIISQIEGNTRAMSMNA